MATSALNFEIRIAREITGKSTKLYLMHFKHFKIPQSKKTSNRFIGYITPKMRQRFLNWKENAISLIHAIGKLVEPLQDMGAKSH